MFYHYSQNNSGGEYDLDAPMGIGVHVVVEAPNAIMANAQAESIGLYFDGVDDGRDCPCCGDRWHPVYEDEGEIFPHIYGAQLSEGEHKSSIFVHYLDGTVKEF